MVGGGKWEVNAPSDVLIHSLILSETIFPPVPLWTAGIFSVGGVWIFFWNNPMARNISDPRIKMVSYFI
jgi:hypothetical protein